jgi:DNA-binding ferritin-like protein
MKSNVILIINKLRGYSTAIKNLHWSANSMSEHKLCDDIADSISDNEDEISEGAQGLYGQIAKNEVKAIPYTISSTKEMLNDLLKDINEFYDTIKDGDELTGIRSVVENFISEINKFQYLIGLCIKEDFKRKIKNKLNENKTIIKLTENDLRECVSESIKKVLEATDMDSMIKKRTHEKYNLGNGTIIEINLEDPTLTIWKNNQIINEYNGKNALNRIEYLINVWKEKGGEFEDILRNIFH